MEKELESSGKVAEAHCRLGRVLMVPVRFGLRGGCKYARNYQVSARFRELAGTLGGLLKVPVRFLFGRCSESKSDCKVLRRC